MVWCHVPINLFALVHTNFFWLFALFVNTIFFSLISCIHSQHSVHCVARYTIIDEHWNDGHAVIRTRIIGRREKKNGSRDMQNTVECFCLFFCWFQPLFHFGHAVSLGGCAVFFRINCHGGIIFDHEERFQSRRRLFDSVFFVLFY